MDMLHNILVGITTEQQRALATLSARQGASRAAIVRRAIDDLTRRELAGEACDGFGLWGMMEDGVDQQRRLRDEW